MAFEIATALIGLGGALLGGAISSLTTIAIHYGQSEKHRRERSWDLRREAYTTIIGSLDRARAILEHIEEGYKQDPHGYDASEANGKASAQMIEFFHVARASFHANRLMLSKAFIGKYDELNSLLEEASNPDVGPVEKAGKAAEITRTKVGEMEDMAVAELGIAL
jgi:hypothetical protein